MISPFKKNNLDNVDVVTEDTMEEVISPVRKSSRKFNNKIRQITSDFASEAGDPATVDPLTGDP